MNRTILSLAAAAAIASTAALLPSRASAMGVGTASAIEIAVAGASMLEDVALVCRHRGWRSRRVCWRTYPRRWRYYRRW